MTKPAAPVRDLLTVEQAAEYLHCSQSSIRSYIRKGDMKAFRVAGRRTVLIDRSELEKILVPIEKGTDLLDDDSDPVLTTETGPAS